MAVRNTGGFCATHLCDEHTTNVKPQRNMQHESARIPREVSEAVSKGYSAERRKSPLGCDSRKHVIEDTRNSQKCPEPPEIPSHLGNPEAAGARGRETQKAQREWAETHLRRDFADANHWAELARTYGVRLPQWWVACTPAKMRRWLHKLGFSLAWWREWSGWRRFEPWIEANPQWPLRAFVGLLLEEKGACDGQVD